jgi:hypothetical protein
MLCHDKKDFPINKKIRGLSRERTVTTERPQIVGEISANFCGKRVPRGERDGSLRL